MVIRSAKKGLGRLRGEEIGLGKLHGFQQVGRGGLVLVKGDKLGCQTFPPGGTLGFSKIDWGTGMKGKATEFS